MSSPGTKDPVQGPNVVLLEEKDNIIKQLTAEKDGLENQVVQKNKTCEDLTDQLKEHEKKIARLENEKEKARCMAQTIEKHESDNIELQTKLDRAEKTLSDERRQSSLSSLEKDQQIKAAEDHAEAKESEYQMRSDNMKRAHDKKEADWKNNLDVLRGQMMTEAEARKVANIRLNELSQQNAILQGVHNANVGQPVQSRPGNPSQQGFAPITAMLGTQMDGLRKEITRLTAELNDEKGAHEETKQKREALEAEAHDHAAIHEKSRREMQSLRARMVSHFYFSPDLTFFSF